MSFRMRKRSRNSRLDKSSVGCSVQVRSAPAPFRPPFWHLPIVLIEVMSPLADILKHKTAWSLHDTTPIVRNSHLTPQIYSNQPTQIYNPHLGKLPSLACKASPNQGPLPHPPPLLLYDHNKTNAYVYHLRNHWKRSEKRKTQKNLNSSKCYRSFPQRQLPSPEKTLKPYTLNLTTFILHPKSHKLQKQPQQ